MKLTTIEYLMPWVDRGYYEWDNISTSDLLKKVEFYYKDVPCAIIPQLEIYFEL